MVDHVNQQVGRLETAVSKNTNLNDNRQYDNMTYPDKYMGFHSKPLNTVFLVGRRYPAYGSVSGYDVLMQQFYGIHMEKNEKVQSYVTRMEGSLHQI